MPLRPPTEDDLLELGDRLWLDLTDEEVAIFLDLIESEMEAYETVRTYIPEQRLGGGEVRSRTAGTRVSGEDNPHNAWVSSCLVSGVENGPLSGMKVAVKDNISVAGTEMTCGSSVMEGYVPNIDATVVTRLLDAGADIVGKTNMDAMGTSTTGHSAFGPILHPTVEGRLAGGSSGGSAVVVANGEVDGALGTDQGGSVRIPAAHCGIVGLKPTYGLVPYTGCIGLEFAVDHPGPMAKDVETVASLLSVIAGGSTTDARQTRSFTAEPYASELTGDVRGCSVGILKEAFERPNGDERVLNEVRDSIDCFDDCGTSTEVVSIPLHEDVDEIHTVTSCEGMVAAVSGEGLGHGPKSWYDTTWVDAFGKFRRAHSDEFSATLKLPLLLGAYTSRNYHSRYYARGMNMILDLQDEYDTAFEEVDLLVMPTVATTAPKHDPDQDEFDRLRMDDQPSNTAAFNLTGHPAITVPVGTVDGLPVGLMIVGQRFADGLILDAALAIQNAVNFHGR